MAASPAGLFVLTCTCRMSGGMTQTGYPALVTTIHTQTHYNLGAGERWGADSNETKTKREKQQMQERNSTVMP